MQEEGQQEGDLHGRRHSAHMVANVLCYNIAASGSVPCDATHDMVTACQATLLLDAAKRYCNYSTKKFNNHFAQYNNCSAKAC